MFDDSLFSFYELFAPFDLVSDLYDENLLTPLTVTTLVIAFGMVMVYYYGLNGRSPRYDGLMHWGLIWLTSGLLAFLVVLITCWQEATQELPRSGGGVLFDQGLGTFLTFSFEMFMLTLILFFVFSILFKGRSTHAKNRPFLWPNSVR